MYSNRMVEGTLMHFPKVVILETSFGTYVMPVDEKPCYVRGDF
jgi:hypothetical protein